MNVNRRAIIGGVAAAGASVAMIGASPAAPKRGGILRVAADFQPTNLDPVAGSQGGDFRFLYPIYQSLVDSGEDVTVVAYAAKDGSKHAWAGGLTRGDGQTVITLGGIPFQGAGRRGQAPPQ